MALGWDLAIAKACLHLNLPFVACVPFEGQEFRWLENQQAYYFRLLKYAKDVIYVNQPPFAVWKLMKRNEYIVDNCDHLLVLWDGNTNGGTYNCITYANKHNKSMINCWNEWIQFIEGDVKCL